MIDLFIYLLLGSANWTKMCAYIKYINIMENSYFMWLHVDLFLVAIKLLWHYYKHCYNYHKINITKPPQINTLYYCSVLSCCLSFLHTSLVSNKKQINIYINLILIIIIITIITKRHKCLWPSIFDTWYYGNLFLPVLCVLSACVAGSRSLLKLSQPGSYWEPGSCWQVGRSWEWYRRRSGAGGSSHKRITAEIPWYRGIFCR